MYSSDDVEKKCVESRWGEGRNGGALVRKGPRLERTAFSLVSALLREDETRSVRALGGACLEALLAAARTIPAARRVTHSVVSFQVLSLSDIVMSRGEEWPRRSRASPKIQHLAVSTPQLPSR